MWQSLFLSVITLSSRTEVIFLATNQIFFFCRQEENPIIPAGLCLPLSFSTALVQSSCVQRLFGAEAWGAEPVPGMNESFSSSVAFFLKIKGWWFAEKPMCVQMVPSCPGVLFLSASTFIFSSCFWLFCVCSERHVSTGLRTVSLGSTCPASHQPPCQPSCHCKSLIPHEAVTKNNFAPSLVKIYAICKAGE